MVIWNLLTKLEEENRKAMQKPKYLFAILIAILSFMQCNPSIKQVGTTSTVKQADMQIAHLSDGDEKGLKAIRNAFVKANPGYDLDYVSETKNLAAAKKERVLFVQAGGGTATLNSGNSSKFSIGDIILLKEGESLEMDSTCSLLVFTVPEKAPTTIPSFVRPDWDENITDTPGGCATETNAYRRILLTWLDKVGPYQFHAINAHRVRIMDSFSHYHPLNGGFDEFYLVQMAQPKAKIITSNKVDRIENPNSVTKTEAKDLLKTTALKVGDLVYLPRGLMHRGLDGVLAQVITVPGFIPKSEIGVDHHLKAINDKFGLEGKKQLPYNKKASTKVVVK